MIYEDTEQVKSAFRWLTTRCNHEYFTQNRPSKFILEKLEGSIKIERDKDTQKIFESLLNQYKFKKTFWKESVSADSLPALALIPGSGLCIVIEQLGDDSYKCDSPDGIICHKDFPDGSYFKSLKQKIVDKTTATATRMFKKIAIQQRKFIVFAGIASVSINILALASSLYSMQVFDRVIPTGGMSTLVSLSIGVLIALFLEMNIKIARSTILDVAAKNMDLQYSHSIFNRFLKVRCDNLPKSVGTLSGQLQSYSSVRSFISSAILYVLIDFPFAALFLGVILMLGGWQMGAISLISFLVSLVIGLMFRKKIEDLSATSMVSSHHKFGVLVETLQNAELIKATGNGGKLLNEWNELTHRSIDDDIKTKHYSELATYFAAFLQQISYIAIIGVGAYLVSTDNNNTMGSLIAISILSGRMLNPIAMLPNLLVQWGRAKKTIIDLENIYSLEVDNEGVGKPLSPYIHSADISCGNIKFAYAQENISLQISNLEIKQGEKVAILGNIGAGKSTLLKIISGLYNPQEGQILLNNINLQHISRHILSETIGYLPQNAKLLSGTLRDNLTLGLIGVGDDKIIEAANKTGLIQLINSLPQGLDSVIPEGGERVSGGQRQIIALTRMVIANPRVWLLDEPTANMDEGTERNILSMLLNILTKEQTLIMVTHKPLLLAIIERIIIVTPQGIVIDGPKDKVLQKIIKKEDVSDEN